MAARLAVLTSVTALVACLSTQPANAQNTWIVDASGAGSFADLATATTAANDGDILLVRSSLPFAVATAGGKSLTVVGDGAVPVDLVGSLYVTNVPTDGHLTVRNLSLQGDPSARPFRADLLAGPLHLEDLRLQGAPGQVGLLVLDAWTTATLVDCEVRAGNAGSLLDAAQFLASDGVACFGSTFQGGFAFPSVTGGSGLRLAVQQAFISGCTAIGGQGGGLFGEGGYGCLLSPGMDVFKYQSCTFQGGVGNHLDGDDLFAGPPGTSTVLEFDEPHRALKIEQAVLREGETGTLTYTGAPGDLVLGMVSLSPEDLVFPAEQGVLHLKFPLAATVFLGNATTGALSVPFGVPELGPGVDALPTYVQALVQDDDGLKLSAPSMTLLVDASL